MRRFLALLFAFIVIALLTVRPQGDLSAATTTTALPSADTYIDQQQPTLNAGTSTVLRVDGSPVLRTYLKFDLGATSGTVAQATLRVFAETAQSTGFAVRPAGSGWTETGLNATNQPTLGAPLGSSGPVAANSWYQFDVTAQVTAGATVSFELETASSTALRLSSRTGGHPAQLVVSTNEAPPTPTPTPTPDPGSLVVMAAGDIACDPAASNFNGGAGTANGCRQRDTANLLGVADLILPLGDNQYECGGLAAYQASFDLSWGAFKSRIRPAIGNHEHLATAGPGLVGTDCDTSRSAAGYFTYFGAAAPAGAYSFDAGGWHFATVDSDCGVAGTNCASQASWLSSDLAAHPAACSIVFYHHPRWSSGGHGSLVQSDPFWRAAAAAGVEIILNGHDHIYERFAPMDADGVASSAGIREFVVGTGGRNHTAPATIQPNSEVRDGTTFGVLKLTLHADTYEWQFVPIAGQTFSDAGNGSCH